MNEIIKEHTFEELLKNITLGGTEFRYNIKKHKHISSYDREENS